MTTALDIVRYECGIAGEEIADMVDSLEKENDKLREQVTLLHERAKRLVDNADWGVGGCLSDKSKARDIPSRAGSWVKTRHLASLRDALAATADLDGLILCHAEPVAWQTFDGEGGYDYRSYEDNEDYRDDYIKRNSSQKFYENWVIPLYRAWGPK